VVAKVDHLVNLLLFKKTITQWLRIDCAKIFWFWIVAITSLSGVAAEIVVPNVDPAFQIQIKADEIAKEQRGAYDVLAFSGHCQITQGPLTGGAKEIILWIERSLPSERDQAGKIICMMDGDVRLDWGVDGKDSKIRDQRWMGRLFSLYPVNYDASRETLSTNPTYSWLSTRNPTMVQLSQLSR
jgi:hypothetical protein